MQSSAALASARPTSSSRPSYHARGQGIVAHWVHLGAVLSPVIIGEMIKEPEKRWRAIRLSAAVAAVASEALWTHRLLEQRAREEERRDVYPPNR